MPNNYDQSSTGENIELYAFYDTESSRIQFDESFKILQHSSIGKGSLLFYNEGDNDSEPSSVSDCYNLEGVTERNARAFCLKQESGLSANDVIEHKFINYVTWKDYAISILDEGNSIYNSCRDGFLEIEGASFIYEYESVQGYSQGDWGYVLYEPQEWLKQPVAHFQRLVYDAPVYCRLEVNGEEYHLSEGLKDVYEWEHEDILEYAGKHCGLTVAGMEWLKNALPVDLPYE